MKRYCVFTGFNGPNVHTKRYITSSGEKSKVFLVMRGSGRLNVYLNETLVKTVMVDEDKLYDLIDASVPGEHIMKLEFLDDGLELYAFTFG